LAPDAGFYLPAGESAGDAFVSGYVVPAVRGRMSGYVRTARGEVRLRQAPAYHDHNWGTWRGVTWEWGEAGGKGGAVLYGGLHVNGRESASGGRRPVLFVWESARGDGAGHRGSFLGAFPVRAITYGGWHPGPILDGRRVRIPSSVAIDAASGSDRVSVRIHVGDGLASVAGQSTPAASGTRAGGAASRTAFLQLRGSAEIRGTVDGRQVAFDAAAAAETFVPRPGP
jgi:hypothetical protein